MVLATISGRLILLIEVRSIRMENNNSVAYISKINSLTPIEGADKIELATVEGWTSVVQKGIHKEGDLILCITTDAVIPQELAEKWGVLNYLRKGNRVRTVKLKSKYSECILIPLADIYPNFGNTFIANGMLQYGKDLMTDLSIVKYEPPVDNKGQISMVSGKKHRAPNGHFHIYHKFPNQKNVPNMFSEEDYVVITRKIHGTNARYGIVKKTSLSLWDRIRKFFGAQWVDYEYVYGSHNVQKLPDSKGFYATDVWAEIAKKYDIKNKLWKYAKSVGEGYLGKGIIIYGEIYGKGVQGDKYSYGLTEKDFAMFDIQVNHEYQSAVEFELTNTELNLPCVPVLYTGKWSKETQDRLVFNQYIDGTNVPHEGVVVACQSGSREKISKVINPEYHTFGEKHAVPDSH
jgi:RNA ligase (TIGR02306 family)